MVMTFLIGFYSLRLAQRCSTIAAFVWLNNWLNSIELDWTKVKSSLETVWRISGPFCQKYKQNVCLVIGWTTCLSRQANFNQSDQSWCWYLSITSGKINSCMYLSIFWLVTMVTENGSGRRKHFFMWNVFTVINVLNTNNLLLKPYPQQLIFTSQTFRWFWLLQVQCQSVDNGPHRTSFCTPPH